MCSSCNSPRYGQSQDAARRADVEKLKKVIAKRDENERRKNAPLN